MVKIKNNWKPVKLDSSVFIDNIDGLIGIEECTDYDLKEFVSSKPKAKTLQSVKKRNATTQSRICKKQKSDNINLSPSKNGSTSINQCEDNLENVAAWANFGLPKSLLLGLAEQNFSQPTEIQQLTLPASVMGRRDILGAAETGSGKTLAFGLPILTGILKIKEKQTDNHAELSDDSLSESDEENEDENEGIDRVKVVKLNKEFRKPLYGLILTPTRELAIQIKNSLSIFTKYTGINMAVVVGGMAAVKQERLLSKHPEIVIATPGRLWELIQSGNPHLSQIDNIKFLAIDETDRMLEHGHFKELHNLLERINLDNDKRKTRQNFVFSATLTLVHDLPKHLINKNKFKSKKIHNLTPEEKLQKIVDMLGINNPKIVDITKGTGTSSTLTECRISCPIEEKDYYVYYFLQKHPGRTLIFCNSIGCVKRLSTLLALLNCHPLPLHASMQQRQRLKNLERFRDTENSILVATDVAARGLDIPCVDHVLHYQTPRTSESYVHRSGRTARASREGITILLMEPNEFKNYIKLCKTLGKSEDIPTFPVENNFLNGVKQRVNLARDLDKLQLQVRKANSENGWLEKAAEEMDIIIEDMPKRYDSMETNTAKKQADFKRKQLQKLLEKPVFPKGVNVKFPLSNEYLYNSLNKDQINEAAIDVMKNALEKDGKQKNKTIPLYKAKKVSEKNIQHDRVIKLTKFKKDKHKIKISHVEKVKNKQ